MLDNDVDPPFETLHINSFAWGSKNVQENAVKNVLQTYAESLHSCKKPSVFPLSDSFWDPNVAQIFAEEHRGNNDEGENEWNIGSVLHFASNYVSFKYSVLTAYSFFCKYFYVIKAIILTVVAVYRIKKKCKICMG